MSYRELSYHVCKSTHSVSGFRIMDPDKLAQCCLWHACGLRECVSPEALISTDLLPRMPAMHVTPPLIAVVRKMCVLCATNTSSRIGRNRSAMILWIRICILLPVSVLTFARLVCLSTRLPTHFTSHLFLGSVSFPGHDQQPSKAAQRLKVDGQKHDVDQDVWSAHRRWMHGDSKRDLHMWPLQNCHLPMCCPGERTANVPCLQALQALLLRTRRHVGMPATEGSRLSTAPSLGSLGLFASRTELSLFSIEISVHHTDMQ